MTVITRVWLERIKATRGSGGWYGDETLDALIAHADATLPPLTDRDKFLDAADEQGWHHLPTPSAYVTLTLGEGMVAQQVIAHFDSDGGFLFAVRYRNSAADKWYANQSTVSFNDAMTHLL